MSEKKFLIIDKVIDSIRDEKCALEKDLIILHNRPHSFSTQVQDIKKCLSKILELDLMLNIYITTYVPEEYSKEKGNPGE